MNGFDLSTISNCYIGGTQASAIYMGNDKIWPSGPHDYSQDYFTIESLENSNIIKFRSSSSSFTRTLSYSRDKVNWISVISSSNNNGTTMATLNIGEKLYLKGTNTAYATSMGNHTRFWTNKKFNVYGNLNSLINGDNFTSSIHTNSYEPYTFEQLFSECPVIDASNLVFPFTLIKDYMFDYMFNYCTQLETPPNSIWPITGADVNMYSCRYMFRECRKLTKSPIIYDYSKYYSSVNGTFDNMFRGCTVLSEVTAMCRYKSDMFNNWLSNVPATGTFTKWQSISWTWPSGSSGIPSGWTVVDVPYPTA